ncbi:chromo (CHRromatin Organization MOdifier) domain containing protein [Babesia bovis T2Bo]|uniref:'chromo' (CHRromatin Organization MOdifier) domain containing protein n=1 Tax=Babesia bovis TaxID=5865 RepID=A7AN24_BABBO|nr:chromo (CHRromatin Organization MOdifier) domain containing protein [Babesia bovis T2Bo]EDO07958.1 chromo (CHRromatin Organization MOdifier) domain containing protein [Babesia bovis T2Bo]|eukprot:XP_001611526.1 'chromo' (CHRromatin Organization MOdifier) domain containing protein [Babesia bovis T2Bo]
MSRKRSASAESDSKSEYEVEDILEFCMVRKQPKYLVKWKGFSDSDNTWEPENNLKNLRGFAVKMKKLKDEYLQQDSKVPAPSGNEKSTKAAPVPKPTEISSTVKKQKKPDSSDSSPVSPKKSSRTTSISESTKNVSVEIQPSSRQSSPVENQNKSADKTADVMQVATKPEEAVEVEDLLDYKPRLKKDYFFVRWKGEWEDSWEPRHNLLIVGDLMNKMNELKMSYMRIYGTSEMEDDVFVTVQSIRISGSATLSAVVVEMTRDTESRTLLPLQEVRRRWPQQLLDFLLSRLRLRASGDVNGDHEVSSTHGIPLK